MQEQDTHLFLPFLAGHRIPVSRQYLISILLVCFVSAVCFLFSAYIGDQVVAFILLLTLSLIAMVFDILPVLVTALLSALIWDFFFLPPVYQFALVHTEDKILLSMYFVIALLNAVLTFKIRQVEKIARRKEGKAKAFQLYNTLLNSLSHEFRTPLAAIIGASDALLDHPSRLSEDDREKLLTTVSIAALRLNRQVENLLNMSRLESGFLQPRKDWCDIGELVNAILQQLAEPLVGHTVETDIKDGLPLVRLDYGLMEQVLYNLVHNATLYTPERSRISIRAGCPDEDLEIVVEDNGNGIPEEEIGNVFDKFYRLKDSRAGGSGLGLSIVKGFVEAHNGTIELKNRATGGARFVMRLPAEKLFVNQEAHGY